jgi:hypothetical protein
MDGRDRKIHEKAPKTPFQRLLESPEVVEKSKTELTRRRNGCDPAVLNSRLNRAAEKLLKINRERGTVKQPSCQQADRTETV